MVRVAWLINQSINQSVFRVIFVHSVIKHVSSPRVRYPWS